MNRNELVVAAKAAGIEKAHTMKSVVLEEMLAGMEAKETKKKGRPVNVNSVRQQRLAELEEKRVNGELKRGRPVNGNSNRQVRLAELELKRFNGELRKGRPVNETSARQMRLRDLEERRMNGTLKLGRPKMIKIEE
jgi:hypothetical protein